MSILVPFLPWMESNCSCNSSSLWKREYFRIALRLASESSVTTSVCEAGVKGNVLSHWDIRLQSICIESMYMHAKQIHESYFFCIVYAYSLLVYNMYAKYMYMHAKQMHASYFFFNPPVVYLTPTNFQTVQNTDYFFLECGEYSSFMVKIVHAKFSHRCVLKNC